MRFESVVFADTAPTAALSCLARLSADKQAGRRTLVLTLAGAPEGTAIVERGLAEVRAFGEVEGANGAGDPGRPWRERIAVVIRRLDPRHVLAPLGLFGASPSIDYFKTLRSAMSVDRGRDLLFFEERPHCLVAEAVPLRLAGLGVRLPPASELRSPRRFLPFALRFLFSWSLAPTYGGLAARARLVQGLKSAFQEAADWDPGRALGPKLQPVVDPWPEELTPELFTLASELGVEERLGSRKSLRRRMGRHARRGGRKTPIERYWLSLPAVGSAGPGDED